MPRETSNEVKLFFRCRACKHPLKVEYCSSFDDPDTVIVNVSPCAVCRGNEQAGINDAIITLAMLSERIKDPRALADAVEGFFHSKTESEVPDA